MHLFQVQRDEQVLGWQSQVAPSPGQKPEPSRVLALLRRTTTDWKAGLSPAGWRAFAFKESKAWGTPDEVFGLQDPY